MPRKTKETSNEELNEKKIAKKVTKKNSKVSLAKNTSKSNTKSSTKNTVSSKKSTTKKATTQKKSTKTSSSKNKSEKKSESTKLAKTNKSTKTKTKNTTIKKTNPVFSSEYYDLPYKYNQTVVKILAQTPTTLFIYWEISDSDRESLKNAYGKYFFEVTKPVLIVHNETLNYAFTVDINDFANSWYLHVRDSASRYKIELGRIPVQNINYDYIPNYDVSSQGPIEPINLPYIYISSSNELDSPNDKILDNKLDKIYFRNLKTNELIEKSIFDFPNIYQNGKFVNIYELYTKLYKNEIAHDSFNLYNPSSGNLSSGSFSSQFK